MNFNGTFTQVIDDLVQQVMPSLVVVAVIALARAQGSSGMQWDSS